MIISVFKRFSVFVSAFWVNPEIRADPVRNNFNMGIITSQAGRVAGHIPVIQDLKRNVNRIFRETMSQAVLAVSLAGTLPIKVMGFFEVIVTQPV